MVAVAAAALVVASIMALRVEVTLTIMQTRIDPVSGLEITRKINTIIIIIKLMVLITTPIIILLILTMGKTILEEIIIVVVVVG